MAGAKAVGGVGPDADRRRSHARAAVATARMTAGLRRPIPKRSPFEMTEEPCRQQSPGGWLPTRGGIAARARARHARFIVLTGLSGSGKSQAIRALEDLGYFCVDNIPTTLIPTLADLVRREGISRVAIVVDIREKNFLAEFPEDLPEAPAA